MKHSQAHAEDQEYNSEPPARSHALRAGGSGGHQQHKYIVSLGR